MPTECEMLGGSVQSATAFNSRLSPRVKKEDDRRRYFLVLPTDFLFLFAFFRSLRICWCLMYLRRAFKCFDRGMVDFRFDTWCIVCPCSWFLIFLGHYGNFNRMLGSKYSMAHFLQELQMKNYSILEMVLLCYKLLRFYKN